MLYTVINLVGALVFLICGVAMYVRQRIYAAAIFAGIAVGLGYPFLIAVGGLA